MRHRLVGGRLLSAASITALLLFGQAAAAPAREGFITLQGEEQVQGYRSIEDIFPNRVVKRGASVYPLPAASSTISPRYQFGAETGSVDEYMARNRVAGLLVLQGGKIVLEKYALGQKPNDRWTSFSVGKSVTSTLIGAAIKDGKIKSVSEPITKYIPELKGSAYDGVTIEQVLMMRSGVAWNEDYADPNSDVGKLVASMARDRGDSLIATMVKLKRAAPAGSRYLYSTGESNLIGILVTRATGKSLADYLSEKVWAPFGMERDAIWMTDGGIEIGGCCISMTLKDYGRFGLFFMKGGIAGGQKVLPDGWVEKATTAYTTKAFGEVGYGYQWWPHEDGAYEAIGIMGQSIYIDPKRDLVVVQSSAWPNSGDDQHYGRQAAFIKAAKAALAQPASAPASGS